MADYVIAPSILSADFAHLGDEIENVIKSGADWIHFDVMDNHYVPNLTVGPMVLKAIRPLCRVPIDVHIMAKPVDRLITDFLKAGADFISFHPEASEHIHRSLRLIKEGHAKAGLALNPATSLDILEFLLDDIDFVLLMSVNPGFGGQSFIPSIWQKAQKTHEILQYYFNQTNRYIRLEIDGGINANNIAGLARSGVDTFVAGSSIFGQKNKSDPHFYDSAIRALKKGLPRPVGAPTQSPFSNFTQRNNL